MKADIILNQVLLYIRIVKDDAVTLQKILDFLQDEIPIPDKEELQVPEKYNEVVKLIADNLNAGLISYLNPDTLEVEDVFNELLEDPENFDEETGEFIEEFGFTHGKWDKCISIEPLVSHESFDIMEKFVQQLDESKLKNRLIKTLENRKPFAHFKQIIDDSEFRQDWFDFKDHYLQNYVKEIILSNI